MFLLNVPIVVLLIAGGPARAWRTGPWPGPGRARSSTPAVLALVLPLVLGQSEHWPAWGWACLAASTAGFAAFAVERRLAAAGGSPLIPGRVLRLPGVAMGIAALFAVLAVFGGFFRWPCTCRVGWVSRRCGPGSPSLPPGLRSPWSA